MKILIVDDEKLTRDGLASALDWPSLGIDTVETAANGAEGLSIAEKSAPDIILTDVRMPHLTGIEMAEKIQERFPDTSVIFMSGYSDKEYLKAAIRLNAVSYVEKPLNLKEVTDAIKEAAEKLSEKQLASRGQYVKDLEVNNNMTDKLIHGVDPEDIPPKEIPGNMSPSDYFTSVILEFNKSGAGITIEHIYNTQIEFSKYIAKKKLNSIYSFKDSRHFCIFIYGSSNAKDSMVSIAEEIRKLYADIGTFTLALGPTVSGMSNAYVSYNSAVALLQQGFYMEENSNIYETGESRMSPPIIEDRSAEFYDALIRKEKDECEDILSAVKGQFRVPCMLLPSQAKDIYYKLFTQLQRAAEHSKIAAFLVEENKTIYDMVDNASSIVTLHRILKERTEEFFELSSEHSPDNGIVFAIEEFVHRNYQNESLSVKTISDHVNRSTSYVCTLFKNETGMTLNQFITKYRLDSAREMLSDPRYKITEVASKCGYNDVNYFGKIFKKYMGCSPSEYRGRMG